MLSCETAVSVEWYSGGHFGLDSFNQGQMFFFFLLAVLHKRSVKATRGRCLLQFELSNTTEGHRGAWACTQHALGEMQRKSPDRLKVSQIEKKKNAFTPRASGLDCGNLSGPAGNVQTEGENANSTHRGPGPRSQLTHDLVTMLTAVPLRKLSS